MEEAKTKQPKTKGKGWEGNRERQNKPRSQTEEPYIPDDNGPQRERGEVQPKKSGSQKSHAEEKWSKCLDERGNGRRSRPNRPLLPRASEYERGAEQERWQHQRGRPERHEPQSGPQHKQDLRNDEQPGCER